ncbi:MAG: redoxin domain-containing protein [Archangiaceae bacterium]|nr:redoxin domain-containing protein [Archangiaceae bacterium]
MAISRVALLCLVSACAGARQTVRTVPSLTLRSATGEVVTLESLTQKADATVLVFWSAGCPCVRRYQARVEALRSRPRVQVLAVSSNAGESFDDVLRVANERGVTVPLYRDDTGAIAALVNARSTPTAAVLDRTGAVRFTGWVDNERDVGADDREPWLERALDGVLGGSSFAARTPTWGCTITRHLFTPEPQHCSAVH